MKGERLADIRKDRGMKQQELAEHLSVSVTTVSGYENDQNTPNDEIKVNIAKIFNISLDYLLGAIDEETALDRSNVLVLPKGFPPEARDEVLEYAKLMILKYRSKEKQTACTYEKGQAAFVYPTEGGASNKPLTRHITS